MAASGATSIGFAEEAKHLMTQSVLETDDLTDFLNRANLADKNFESEHERFVIIDDTAHDIATIGDYSKQKDNGGMNAKDLQFDFTELSVPRRPKWDASTTPEELDKSEKEAFLSWRRRIAQFEEQVSILSSSNSSSSSSQFSNVTVTPFEKNIQVWRQLWRVLERSDVVILIVDARNPLFYISLDLRKYVEEELGKYMMVILNKSDYLTERQRLMWHMYFESMGLDHIFFSAYMEQLILDEEAKRRARVYDHEDDSEDGSDNGAEKEDDSNDSDTDDDEEETETNDLENVSNTANTNNDTEPSPQAQDNTSPPIGNDNHSNNTTSTTQTNLHQDRIGIHHPISRKQLLELLLEFASLRGIKPTTKGLNNTTSSPRIEFGMVGFPNVGKSSVINVLVGASKNDHLSSRVAVAAQPGKTRHFQTLNVPDRDDFTLCDCPGLVFPSFVSSLADLILAGVYPLAQVRDFWPAMELICNRIPRDVLEAFYGIDLPRPSRLDIAQAGKKLPLKPPTARQLLDTYCISRSLLSPSSGVPDHHRAARVMLGDYVNGRVLYCHCPPVPKITEDVSKQDQEKWNTAYLTETFHTTFERSKKLLNKNMSTSSTSTSKSKLNTVKEEADSSTTVDTSDGKFLEDENLDDMLDIVGSSEIDNKGGKRGKKHKTMQKWGKKDRKNRNKDPYGCHTEPDEELFRTSTGPGLCVKAGKYGSSSYTRPNYAGARSAVAFEQTHETQ
jgi:large subunit GTPase 1